MTQLKVALRGNLEKSLRQELDDTETAVTGAVRAAGAGLKKSLRRDIVRAGLGQRLGKTWRGKVFPKTGKSLGSAAVVSSKAPVIIDAFERGVTIRGKRGNLLAIPTPAASTLRGLGRAQVTPAAVERLLGTKLRPVKRPGKPLLLVADGLRAGRGKRGGFVKATVRKATKTQGERVLLKGLTAVVMFTLVRSVRLKKRLNAKRLGGKWQARLPRLILRHYPRRAEG